MVPQHVLESLIQPHPRWRIPRQHGLGGVASAPPLPLAQSDDFPFRSLRQRSGVEQKNILSQHENFVYLISIRKAIFRTPVFSRKQQNIKRERGKGAVKKLATQTLHKPNKSLVIHIGMATCREMKGRALSLLRAN